MKVAQLSRPNVQKRAIKTAYVSVSDYLANPAAATKLAERVGRVVVRDDNGTARLVISSNRATETWLDGVWYSYAT